MGLKDFSIEIDSSWGGYYPGQVVSGKIACTFDSPKTIRGLIVKFKGRAETRWSETHTRTVNGKSHTETIYYSAAEEYFQREFYLLGSKSGEQIEIPAGTVSYPFSYTLPMTLPSSFEGDYGFIRYTIKATLERPWKFDQDTKMAFTVISQVDLNYMPQSRYPFRLEKQKKFCCWCCKSGALTVSVGLPKTGYCPGEILPVEILVENGSNVSVREITILLIKSVTFHSHSPRSGSKHIDISIAKVKTDGVPNFSTKTLMQELEVPPLPPSNLDNCSIIDLTYKLQIICGVPGFHCNMEGSSPILIGTVPLNYNSQQVEYHMELPNAVTSNNPYNPQGYSPYPSNSSIPPHPINSSQPPFANPYSPNPIQFPTAPYPTETGKNPPEALPPSYESVVGPNLPYPPATSTAPYPTNFPSAGGSPYNSQMFDTKPPANSNPSAPLMEDTNLNLPSIMPQMPFPSVQPVYRPSQFTATSIHDDGDNPYTRISGNTNFAPSYPTYGFLFNQPTPNLNTNQK